MKKLIRLTESDLHRVVKESVKKILKEYEGGSSANGYSFNMSTGDVERNQGGSFGGNGLDQMHDREKFEKEQQAKRFSDSQAQYK